MKKFMVKDRDGKINTIDAEFTEVVGFGAGLLLHCFVFVPGKLERKCIWTFSNPVWWREAEEVM